MSRRAALATRLVGEAREQIQAGRQAQATELLLDALEVDPDNNDAQRLLEDHRSLERGRAGENKQLTIVFTDQVGSTAFVERHGAEATTRIFRRYHELFGRAVESHGGLIQSFQGDGLVACFGHPVAYGNDAARAVDASLAMLDSLEPLERLVADELDDTFAIRIGIHTGDVVVAELGTAISPLHHAITGVTPNVTSRLQDLASPREIIISDVTAQLLPAAYELKDHGAHRLKGVTREMATFLVRGVDRERTNPRFLLSPHVGRTAELATLESLWTDVAEGQAGRSCLLSGEPGLGKSRVLASIRDLVSTGGGLAVNARGNDQEQSQPLRYVTRAFSLALGGDGGQLDPDIGLPAATAINALFLQLETSQAAEVDPMALRQQALADFEVWLAGRASHQPMCLLFDDFQWADASTRSWLADFVTRVPPGVLVIIGSRDIELSLTVDAAVELFPLDELAATSLVAHLVGDDAERIASIVANADGVPLFLEELAQASSERMPATLREIVQAELEPESLRYFAQLMATIGRTIPRDILDAAAAAAGYEKPVVDDMLTRLLAKGLVQPAGKDAFSFRHHLVWRAAYESQLDEVRIERHGTAADSLAMISAPDDNPHADFVGRSYLNAQRPVEAATFLLSAVGQNQMLGGHAEALEQLTLVAEAIVALPPEMAPVFDVGLRMRRAFSTIATRGYADPDVQADFATAAGLCRALAPVPELKDILTPALLGLWSYYAVAGDFVAGQPLIGDLRALDPGAEWDRVVEVIDGMDHFFRGDLDGAAAILDRVESSLDDAAVPTGWALPNDPSVCGLAVAGAVAVLRGDERSTDFIERALARATALPFPVGPVSAALTHTYVAMAHGLRGEHDRQTEHGSLAKSLGDRHGLIEWSMLGSIHQLAGRSLSGEGALREELSTMTALWRSTGAGACVPALLAFQADLELERDNPTAADELVAEAAAFATATGQGLGADLLLDLDQRLSQLRKATS